MPVQNKSGNLFKAPSMLLKKILNFKLITCNYIYINNSVKVYSENEEANLHIHHKNLILLFACYY